MVHLIDQRAFIHSANLMTKTRLIPLNDPMPRLNLASGTLYRSLAKVLIVDTQISGLLMSKTMWPMQGLELSLMFPTTNIC